MRFNLGCGLLTPLLIALTWGWGVASPGLAAERLKIQLGPFEQQVTVAELERFVNTGRLSSNLRLYSGVLTPEIRKSLGKSVQIDPEVASQAIDDVLESSRGQQLLNVLKAVIPDANSEQIRAGLTLAAQQADGLNVITVLKALPKETVTIDATTALAVASQINLDFLGSQTLNPTLERELMVASGSFTPAFNPAAPGPEAVKQKSLLLEDSQRDRQIPLDLYWSQNSRGPLVVMSHGFGSNRKFLIYLARHLASHGLTVAALDHPGSNADLLYGQTSKLSKPTLTEKSLLSAQEFVDRPKDVSFLLNQLKKLNRQPGALQGKLHTESVTVLGHSLGGTTALSLAGGTIDLNHLRRACKLKNPVEQAFANWFQCSATELPGRQLNFRDRRVTQIIAINPLVGDMFGTQGLRQVAVPTLMVSGTDDVVTPALANQLQPFTQLPQPKYLLTAIGGTHLSISDPTTVNGKWTLTKEQTGPTAEPLRELLKGTSLAFISQQTPAATLYKPFLTPAYAQSLSTRRLPLRLNTMLPASVARLFR